MNGNSGDEFIVLHYICWPALSVCLFLELFIWIIFHLNMIGMLFPGSCTNLSGLLNQRYIHYGICFYWKSRNWSSIYNRTFELRSQCKSNNITVLCAENFHHLQKRWYLFWAEIWVRSTLCILDFDLLPSIGHNHCRRNSNP